MVMHVLKTFCFLKFGVRISNLPLWMAFVLAGAFPGFGPVPTMAGSPPGFLHTRGQDIVDEQGRRVMLRGVGLGNWLLPEGYMWKFGGQADRPRRIEKLVTDLIGPENAARFWSEYRRNYITEVDVQRIAELGFNSVRPAVNARLFQTETEPSEPVEEGFQLLDALVKACHAHGVYVVIDMHGAPGGQTGQNIDDSANDQPELFMQTNHQEQLVKLWTAIARRYKDEPAVAGYDLLNEPLPERTGAAAKFKDQVEPLYRRLARAIRAVDSRHLLIVEGVNWANDWSIFTKPFDKNLVYQFHYYCWDTPAKLKSIAHYLDYRKRLNAPVWVGETGERDNGIYWATTDYFEANNVGWSFWPWKKLGAENGPCSVNVPQDWESVVAYSRGEAKPSREVAQRGFDELLRNIRLENCVFHPAVVNAMLRRVPARIEAENFGQEGANVSFGVKDASRHSSFYRLDEPVQISVEDETRRNSARYISLSQGEWTAYDINNEAPRRCEIAVRARVRSGPASAQLQVGEQLLNIELTDKTWKELRPGTILMPAGPNRLKWMIKQGEVDLDWLEVTATEEQQTSAPVGDASQLSARN
jgi:hypothetical protein